MLHVGGVGEAACPPWTVPATPPWTVIVAGPAV